MKILENTKKVSIVVLCGSRDQLTQNMNGMRDVNIEKQGSQQDMMIASGMIKGLTISGLQVNIELHRCID